MSKQSNLKFVEQSEQENSNAMYSNDLVQENQENLIQQNNNIISQFSVTKNIRKGAIYKKNIKIIKQNDCQKQKRKYQKRKQWEQSNQSNNNNNLRQFKNPCYNSFIYNKNKNKNIVLRSYKQKIEETFNSIQSQSKRTLKIREELLKYKQNLYEQYRSIHQNIIKKQYWRSEIVEEMYSYLGSTAISQMKAKLQIKEEELRSSLFLMNKQNSNQSSWNYILVNPAKKFEFQSDIQKGQMQNLNYYGNVILKGQGENPPVSIIKKIQKEFLLFEYEPGYALKKKGLEAQVKGDLVKSNEYFEEYLKKYNATNRFSLMKRGQNYMKMNEFNKALGDFEKCMKLYPYNNKSFLNAGWINLQQGKFSEAIEKLNKASNLQPNDATPLIYRALSYLELKEFNDARKSIEKSLKIDPNNVFATTVLHKIKIQQNNNQNIAKEIQNNNNNSMQLKQASYKCINEKIELE